MIICNESGNYHPILIKRPGSELLENCKQLVWLQSRTERFPRKVGGGGGAEEKASIELIQERSDWSHCQDCYNKMS